MRQVADPFVVLVELWRVLVSLMEPFSGLGIFIDIDSVELDFPFGQFHVHVGA